MVPGGGEEERERRASTRRDADDVELAVLNVVRVLADNVVHASEAEGGVVDDVGAGTVELGHVAGPGLGVAAGRHVEDVGALGAEGVRLGSRR